MDFVFNHTYGFIDERFMHNVLNGILNIYYIHVLILMLYSALAIYCGFGIFGYREYVLYGFWGSYIYILSIGGVLGIVEVSLLKNLSMRSCLEKLYDYTM